MPDLRRLLTGWLRDAASAPLAAWLSQQRWFGAKSRVIAGVDLVDLVWLQDSPAAALVLVETRYAPAVSPAPGASTRAASDRYALLLTTAADGAGHAIAPLPGAAATVVVEGGTDGRALAALLGGLAGAAVPAGDRGGRLRYADGTPAAEALLADPAAITAKAVGAEQSNTSVRLGAGHVFKLFRRLEPGVHPQVEMARFLTGAGFGEVPALAGSIVYEDGSGTPWATGVLEHWVPNQGDGWSYALACLGQDHDALAPGLTALGATTADLHAALASDASQPDFAPVPATDADRAGWRHRLLAQGERAAAVAPRVASYLARLAEVAERAPATSGAFDRIRIHGDLHLGQTLRTPGGFVLIDFEGEPSKPVDQRRRKQCALQDVAGMLRSIDYAVATAGGGAGAPPLLDRLRGAFLDGYLTRAHAGRAMFLPPPGPAFDAWLAHFEIEKALYEVEYEANNRPAWLPIPLQALERLLGEGA